MKKTSVRKTKKRDSSKILIPLMIACVALSLITLIVVCIDKLN